ncbi:MAG: TonB-dependent receptor [candidate division KSB1 bacterium]
MKKSLQKFLCVLSLGLLLPHALWASAAGTISGFISDEQTGTSLPGATVTIEGTNFGAMADKHGFYIIYNVPVGEYTLRVSMIGYVPMKLTNVAVKTDLNTRASFEMKGRALEVVDEIVVIAPRVQILRDVLSSTHYYGTTRIEKTLPGLTYEDVLPTIPGFVANHFRGSRATSTQYLIDGLPANGSYTREMAFSVAKSAIAEMVVQTGGFSAEYGNATSAVTNIITKEGRNDLGFTVKVASDIGSGKDLIADNARRAEFALGGPLTFGFGGPMFDANYMIAGSAHLTNTPFHNELRQYFPAPVFFNYDLNTKIMMRVTKNIFVRWQGLFSQWDWRRYEALWAERNSALPKRSNSNRRMSLSITHTVSPKMYYKAELSALDLSRTVRGAIADDAANNYTFSADQSLAQVWPGALQPWLENTHERQWTASLNLVRQLHPAHQLKLGLEANVWSLATAGARYQVWPKGNEGELVYDRSNDQYHRRPFTIAAYGHHKIELNDFLATLGMRYEAFSPNTAPVPLAPRLAEAQNDSIFTPTATILHHTLAPRLGLAIPIGEVEHLSFNYGWFYELPSFYYLYLNADNERSAFWPLLGNPELQPVRARAWEVTYRRAWSDQMVFSLTGFWRKYANLIGTLSYPAPASSEKLATPASRQFFRYENNVSSSMSGLEAAYQREMGPNLTVALSYTYLESFGTASWPESDFLRISREEPGADTNLGEPLAWDQRHTFTLNLAYHHGKGYAITLFSKLYGPAQSHEWLTNRTTELGWRNFLDTRITLPLSLFGLKLEPFLEVRNLLDIKYANPEPGGLDFSQPSLRFEEFYGRRAWVGFSLK